MTLKGCTIPDFKLNGTVVASYTYLGHYITYDLSDDEDINRQRRKLIVQGNITLRKFSMFLRCETHTSSYLLFTYVYSTTLVNLQKNLPLPHYK